MPEAKVPACRSRPGLPVAAYRQIATDRRNTPPPEIPAVRDALAGTPAATSRCGRIFALVHPYAWIKTQRWREDGCRIRISWTRDAYAHTGRPDRQAADLTSAFAPEIVPEQT